MKIISTQELIASPPGTVYAEIQDLHVVGGITGGLCIKGDSIKGIDWFFHTLLDFDTTDSEDLHRQWDLLVAGHEVPLAKEPQVERDGTFDLERRWIVLADEDVKAVIRKLIP